MKSNAIFSIDLTTLNRLNELSETTGVSKSAIVRTALQEFFDLREQDKKQYRTGRARKQLLFGVMPNAR